MAYKTPPKTGDIELERLPIAALNNGQLRRLCSDAGCKLNDIRAMIAWQEDDVYYLDADGKPELDAKGRPLVESRGKGPYAGPVDEADVIWALGKLALEEAGFEPSDENADRVKFIAPAATEGDPTEAR